MSALLIESLIKFVGLWMFIISLLIFAFWARKKMTAIAAGCSHPHRRGLAGFMSPAFMLIKALLKDNFYCPSNKSILHHFMPAVVFLLVSCSFTVIPFCENIYIGNKWYASEILSTDMGILFALLILLLSSLGIMLAGYLSRNKLALMSSLRICVPIMASELLIVFPALTMIFLYDSMNLHHIISRQIEIWGLLRQPLAAVIFVFGISITSYKSPFDLHTAKNELFAGYKTEYSPLQYILLIFAEQIRTLALIAIFTIIFLGGYNSIGGFTVSNSIALGTMQIISFMIKIGFIYLIISWINVSLPKFRADQLMRFGWLIMLPISMINFIITVISSYYTEIS